MSSLIEKAALRLEQLRQAGVDVAPSEADAPGATTPPASAQAPRQAQPPAAVSAPARASLDPESMSRQVEIDMAGLMARGFITPSVTRSAIADQFRVIKRPLLSNATGKGASVVPNGNLIMVTSAMPGEGKSFTAINLAMSIAMELDHRVLLVDADVARPSLMEELGLPATKGLLDLLLDERMPMSDVLLRTNVDKLSLLPSGTPHPRATELLASEAMTALVEEMGQRYPDRIIIFDSPPLLLTTESRVLASHMGQVVMVVQAEKTLQSQVRHAMSTIESCPIKLLLLNQARSGGQEAYGYGYGYGYASAPSATAVAATAHA